jgi:SAM-dependent methyltransferase
MASRELSQRPQGSTGAGAFVPTYHREMLMDRRRVRAFHKAIEALGGPDKTLLELGPGTGVLSAFAARHFGSVVAVERDENMYQIARANLARQGLLDGKVTLIHGDAMDLALEPADVIVGEFAVDADDPRAAGAGVQPRAPAAQAWRAHGPQPGGQPGDARLVEVLGGPGRVSIALHPVHAACPRRNGWAKPACSSSPTS